jgi:quercetin dioxygenase-like cupin family protein
MTSSPPTIIPPHGGTALDCLGDRIILKLEGPQTRDCLALMEITVAIGQGVVPHRHDTFDEVYYLLTGELTITIDGATQPVSAGTVVQIPQGTIHSYRNTGITAVRMLVWAYPAGIEQFFRAIAQSAATQPSPEQIGAIAAQYDIHVSPGQGRC